MSLPVSDARSNPQDQIAHAAKVLGRSNDRRKVFEAIYRDKSRVKTVQDLKDATGLSRVRVLQEGKKLSSNHIVRQTKTDGDTAYEKDAFYAAQKSRILSLAQDPKKLSRYPTKTNPQIMVKGIEPIKIPRQLIRVRSVSIDDIASFSKVRKVPDDGQAYTPMLESVFKRGVKRILGEKGQFKDWGGESNDLYTTRITIKGRLERPT